MQGENEVNEEGEQAEGDEVTRDVEEQKVAGQIMEVMEMKPDDDEDHRE